MVRFHTHTSLVFLLLITLVRVALGGETQAHPTFEVVCPAFDDYCVLIKDGKTYRLKRRQLPEHLPIVRDHARCHIEFCVNADMEVIGLNPNYYMWRHQ